MRVWVAVTTVLIELRILQQFTLARHRTLVMTVEFANVLCEESRNRTVSELGLQSHVHSRRELGTGDAKTASSSPII